MKRRKVSSSSFFSARGQRGEQSEESPAAPPSSKESKESVKPLPHKDELTAYLALPQIENDNEWAGLKWWKDHEGLFPNMSLVARQYLGCPASSASVERLFSAVGNCFTNKRKRADAQTIADLIFNKMNVE